MQRSISIRGARTHNLKNISLQLPLGKLTLVTGISGSGKSSLVFDTLYAEGQRRYVQSLSTYARLFLERMDRPDVEAISNIPPALALRQRNTIRNARSTVGTITEISDYARLLFATVGETFCPGCGSRVTNDSVEAAADAVSSTPGAYLFLAPYQTGTRPLGDTLAYLVQNGYHRLFAHGQVVEASDYRARLNGDGADSALLMVVIDRVAVASGSAQRVREALEKAFYLGAGRARVVQVERNNGNFRNVTTRDFDRGFNCAACAISFPEPSPALFSANSPIGACAKCEGFGRTVELDLEKALPNPALSIRQGVVAPWRTPAYREMHDWMVAAAQRRRVRIGVPYREMTDEEKSWLLNGEEPRPKSGIAKGFNDRWPGVRGFFKWLEAKRYKTHVRILLARYRRFITCPDCNGSKLKPDALNVRVAGITIAEAGGLTVAQAAEWIARVAELPGSRSRARTVLRELTNRIGYLLEVGLGYLTLERQGRTLSGGEAQRIHLASALGSLLTGTLYALDEPTVGLHARDSRRLLEVLRHLRDLGNTVVVVEHDPTLIAGADYLIELGPGGGREGGGLISAGVPQPDHPGPNVEAPGRLLLLRAIARERRFTHRDPAIKVVGARCHNLRGLDVSIPLGRLVCITGVSGSGKSTLIEEVVYNNFLRRAGSNGAEAGSCERIDGFDQIGEMVHTGQEGLTRSQRSNPATYLKVYDEIRKLFAAGTDARRLGIGPGAFSFNVAGGRCERCRGTGIVTIEMHFMADIDVSCEVCDGRRFQRHVLGLSFQGRNIVETLAMTIDDARSFFARYPKITHRLDALSSVGLGYLNLGQATSTLSGGEAQRLKLARFLLADLEPPNKDARGKPLPRMFILDEPTTGLSSTDIRGLMRVLNRLVADGNSLVVIEHNLEVVAQADYVIDMGPEGGDGGGLIVAAGSPLRVATAEGSYTGRELRRLFGLPVDAHSREVKSALKTAAEG
ncbi:MAG TPA: excinuclease ABC subunit UvrA [Candidatus Binataceae bacterium]